jgi:hypothetical protein
LATRAGRKIEEAEEDKEGVKAQGDFLEPGVRFALKMRYG